MYVSSMGILEAQTLYGYVWSLVDNLNESIKVFTGIIGIDWKDFEMHGSKCRIWHQIRDLEFSERQCIA